MRVLPLCNYSEISPDRGRCKQAVHEFAASNVNQSIVWTVQARVLCVARSLSPDERLPFLLHTNMLGASLLFSHDDKISTYIMKLVLLLETNPLFFQLKF